MSEWEIIRHAVAIAGRVSNAQTGKAVGGAGVGIADAPTEFTAWLATRAKQFGDRWQAMSQRPDRTRTAADGHFHFMDLPNGDYTLVASLPGAGSRYGQAEAAVTVNRGTEGNLIMATVDIQLPPTTLKGRITTEDTEGPVPVVSAEVRIGGSDEKAFSDDQGRYHLAGLEKGLRTVLVSAKGYQPVSHVVGFDAAGVEQILDVVLVAPT
jgi:hypothetical protein